MVFMTIMNLTAPENIRNKQASNNKRKKRKIGSSVLTLWCTKFRIYADRISSRVDQAIAFVHDG